MDEGFLIGERIIPKKLDPGNLWQPLLDFTDEKLYEGKDFTLCERILYFFSRLHLSPEIFVHSNNRLDHLCRSIYLVGHKEGMVNIVDQLLQAVCADVDRFDMRQCGRDFLQILFKTAMYVSVCPMQFL